LLNKFFLIYIYLPFSSFSTFNCFTSFALVFFTSFLFSSLFDSFFGSDLLLFNLVSSSSDEEEDDNEDEGFIKDLDFLVFLVFDLSSSLSFSSEILSLIFFSGVLFKFLDLILGKSIFSSTPLY
jgi:hypothetical protein